MANFLRLTFCGGDAVFDRQGLWLGQQLILKFGVWALLGEIDMPRIEYSLFLSPGGCSIEKFIHGVDGQHLGDPALWTEHDAMVLEMAQRINLSIGKRETLDLSAYTDFWSKKDKYFGVVVRNDLKPLDFQKKPIPNDYGIDFWEAVPKSKMGISGSDGG